MMHPILQASLQDYLNKDQRAGVKQSVLATKGVLSAAFLEEADGKTSLIVSYEKGHDVLREVLDIPGVAGAGSLRGKLPRNFKF